MKFTAGVSLFAALASAISVDLAKRDSPLDVQLEMVDNTAVKAKITNTYVHGSCQDQYFLECPPTYLFHHIEL